jgi:hypothetical protein
LHIQKSLAIVYFLHPQPMLLLLEFGSPSPLGRYLRLSSELPLLIHHKIHQHVITSGSMTPMSFFAFFWSRGSVAAMLRKHRICETCRVVSCRVRKFFSSLDTLLMNFTFVGTAFSQGGRAYGMM